MLRNQRGSAISIILMILGVISLVGVGLLAQSRMDMNITSAIKNYDKMFGLADGAATIAYQDLTIRDKEVPWDGPPPANNPNKYRYYAKDKSNNDLADQTVGTVGTYSSYVKMMEYETDPELTAGWEAGEFYSEFWLGQGEAERNLFVGRDAANPKSDVHVAVTKIRRGN